MDAGYIVSRLPSHRGVPDLKGPSSQNAGQNCVGIERLIVHSSQHDELHDMLKERVQNLRPGPVLAQSQEGYIHTVDLGSMINGARFEGLESIIRQAEDGGAKVTSGSRYNHAYHEHGSYFHPTIVACADREMEIVNEEGESDPIGHPR
jgi:acyl-CoA reductase-like NAD-dependent aldehyde dehydrogenase